MPPKVTPKKDGPQQQPDLTAILAQLTAYLENQSKTQEALLEQLSKPKDNEFLMETLSNTIPEFVYDPQGGLVFDKWYSRHEEAFNKGGEKLEEADKVRLLVRKLSSVDHDRYVNYILPENPPGRSFQDTVDTLKEMFGHQTSVFFRRYQCLQTTKRNAEDFVTYASTVNRACEDFNIRTITSDQFKCLVFVAGLQSERYKDIRTRLLAKMEGETVEHPMTLKKLLLECQHLDNLKHDTAVIEGPKPAVKAVQQDRSGFRESGKPERKFDNRNPAKATPRRPCWQCGQMHFVADCSYTKHTCKTCGKVGHKEGYCACCSKPSGSGEGASHTAPGGGKKKHKKKRADGGGHSNGVYAVNKEGVVGRRKFVEVLINNEPIELQLDCGSDYTIISTDSLPLLGNPETIPTELRVATASGKPLPLELEFECDVTFRGTTKRSVCYVTPVRGFKVLGSDLMEAFGLYDIPINDFCKQLTTAEDSLACGAALKAKFPAVFQEGLGRCTKTKIQLFLIDGAKPVFKPKRPVPFHSQRLVEKELNRLQNMGVLEPVDYSDWAAPIVAVRKAQRDADGDPVVRICADYSTGLNAVLEANKYPLPTPDDIFAKLAGSKFFSVIDLSDAYLQMEVEEESQKLLTMNTHKGLFKVKRLPPGVKPAPGAFQKVVDNMLAGQEGAASFLDDVLVFGRTRAEHDRNLEQTLQRIQDFGFRLKIEKCKFYMTEVKYLGHIINQNGIRTDPGKVSAISQMPPPKNLTELRSFLGAVNYYAKFIKEMHQLRRPLDLLLKKDAKWAWSDDCQRSFERFKELLKSDLMLTHYNPTLDIIVAADASQTGIGATIRHRFPDGSEKIIQHASRSLTPAEQAYGQIDKEALALVYAVTKFHRMLLGRRFVLETDHQPLLRIFGSHKGIPTHTSNRLQRLGLVLLCYNFGIDYVSTANFGYADVLSRLIDSAAEPEEEYVIAALYLEDDMSAVLEDSVGNTPVTSKMIAAATARDKVLKKVVQYLEGEWPASASEIDNPDVKAFYHRKESLALTQGCILFGQRVVVPETYRKRILQRLHHGHPGMVRMKSLARSFVYWPHIDKQVEDTVKQCADCAAAAKSPPHSPPEAWPTPAGPWQRIHIDYAGPIDGLYFLIIVDAFSRWPEIYPTTTTTARATIQFLRSTFARLGLPMVLVSDNAAQFTCDEFESYCKANGITHILTAPYHPQSNGQAERFVDTVKRGMKKINKGEPLQETLDVFLATYRSTPSGTTEQKSPSELLFGRQMRTTLDLLRPPPTPVAEMKTTAENDQRREFAPGDLVYAKVHKRNDWYWEAGKVIERLGSVNYNVWLDGQRSGLIRSHINQLRPRHESADSSARGRAVNLPLDILLGEFGFAQPTTEDVTRAAVVEPEGANQPGITEHNDGPEPAVIQRPIRRASTGSIPPSCVPVPTTTITRSGREVRLPPRFDHYVMS
ncbi:uncharacterized protein K02A2.6-like [Culex pipiens pallens]|uniref:uncharacterized protein K02A2.6-like n=1 Tax=Culex pipiens pallens TaxID=42434 RepID=UPI00195472F3|nr:uncharacterized protein K02A2.6-like [Culex pipiens pallens]